MVRKNRMIGACCMAFGIGMLISCLLGPCAAVLIAVTAIVVGLVLLNSRH